MKNTAKNIYGFSMIELIVVIGILSLLITIIVIDFALWSRQTDVTNSAQEVAGVLRLAQSKTISSENYSQYGVYLNTSASPNQYIIFKGSSYATRDTSADQIYSLPKTVQFSGISLGGGNEMVFDKLTGACEQSGNFSVQSISDNSQIKTIYVANSGVIGFSNVTSPSDSSRVKDSRHVHFDYSRLINTSSENITLNFNNGQTVQTFPVSSYISAGEIEWLGTVAVGANNQTIEIHTHRLNNPDTQFSIHRDGRLNNASLTITISGDTSGNLIQYSSDGLTTNYSSVYVSNLAWQ